MAWRLTGQLIETCSCNMFCPCWFTVQELMIMDQGWCASAIAFRTRDGNSDGVALGGRTVVFAVDFPGPTLFDGNATARLYVDEEANADQRRELEAICSGQKGGPMAAIAPLIAKWLPARSAKIDVADEGDAITVTVGDAGRVESRRLRDPQGQGFTLRGGGFVTGLGMEEVDLAPSGSRWTDPDLRQFDNEIRRPRRIQLEWVIPRIVPHTTPFPSGTNGSIADGSAITRSSRQVTMNAGTPRIRRWTAVSFTSTRSSGEIPAIDRTDGTRLPQECGRRA